MGTIEIIEHVTQENMSWMHCGDRRIVCVIQVSSDQTVYRCGLFQSARTTQAVESQTMKA